MFRRKRITIDRSLFERVERYADQSGYSSPEEFIVHVLEERIAQLDRSPSEEEIRKRLKGLGYL